MTELFTFTPAREPLLISVPHAGTYVPPEILARMTPEARSLPDTDWHVERLYAFARERGIGMVVATHARYVVDLNRDPSGQALYPGADNTEIVPLTTFDRAPVYLPGRAADAAEMARRVDAYWRPYHERLGAELAAMRARFGIAVLWDAHSIRSEVPRFFAGRLPDLNLGSARGHSAAPELVAAVTEVFARQSAYSWVLDGRFTGGHITRHFGQPSTGIHVLQLEMAQVAYMSEPPPYDYLPDRAARLQPLLADGLASLLAAAKRRVAAHAH
ncbi:MAG: N-formylglutamate deformylase [Proteobacteria bacterium]|nr:N-formylglutamate deformylase [Pseudomonadota bacterium]